MNYKFFKFCFAGLIFLLLLTPLWVFKDLLFPFVTSKAFYLRIIVEVTLPFYIGLIVMRKDLRPDLKNPLTLAVLAFWVMNLLSALFGVNIVRAMWGNFERMGGAYYLLHLTLIYFYLLLLSKMDGKLFLFFLKATVWFFGLLSLYGIFTVMGMKPLVQDPSLPGRLSILFGNPIYVGSTMILPMFISAFLARQSEGVFWRAAYWALALFQLIAIVLSGSRGAVVGLIAGLFLMGVGFLVFSKNRKTKIFSSVVLGAFVAIFLTLYLVHEKLPQGSIFARVFNLNDSNTKSRLIQWGVALHGVKEYWLTGTGPENYYVVANKYHNPEISKYDRSWFDKPHNYLLEVLVTAGIFGFLLYAAIFCLSIFGAYLAFKRGLIELLDFLLLSAAITVYQIQNLTVFDNVSASMMFYMFTALCAYLWQESAHAVSGKQSKLKTFNSFPPAFGYVVFGLSAVVCGYLVYSTNVLPLQASKATNYGYAYGSVDPKKSLDYFKQAVNTPFNFDFGETSSKFTEVALNVAYNPSVDRQVAKDFISEALSAEADTISRTDNYSIYQYRYANLLFIMDGLSGRNFSPAGFDAMDKAIALAPKRTEARMFKVQILGLQKDYINAENLAREVIADDPTNAVSLWQYANLLKQQGNTTKAREIAEQALKNNYKPGSWQELSWLLQDYSEQKQFDKAINLLLNLSKAQGLDAGGYWVLAQLYQQAGEKAKAIDLANKIKMSQQDPAEQAKVDAFLKQLGQ